jgi:hypothetical protein
VKKLKECPEIKEVEIRGKSGGAVLIPTYRRN